MELSPPTDPMDAPDSGELASAASDPTVAPVPDTASAVPAILSAFIREQITFAEAAARIEALIGGADAFRQPTGAIQMLLPQDRPAIPGSRRKANRWTPEEDERLASAVHALGTEDWPAVARAVGGGRTRFQCAQRWNRGLDPRLSKGNWTQEEEQALLTAVEVHGTKAWTRIAGALGARSDVQCRFRYRFLCKKAKQAGTPVQPISPPFPRQADDRDGVPEEEK
jgi:hypothetical protein